MERPEEPLLAIDSHVTVSEFMNPDYPMFLEMLEPFGPGYPSPLFSTGDFVVKDSKIVGRSHLKLAISTSMACSESSPAIDLLAWGHGDKLSCSWNEMEIAFTPAVNNWQGRKNLQLVLKDARPRRDDSCQKK